MEQRYRTAGRRVQGQDRQGSKPGGHEKRDLNKQELRHKTLVDLNSQHTNIEHRYKYTGHNGEDGQHLEGGRDKHKDNCNRSGCDKYSHYLKKSNAFVNSIA